MALSKRDFELILKSIEGCISHIEEYTTADDNAEIEELQEFKDKILKMQDEVEIRLGLRSVVCDVCGGVDCHTKDCKRA